MVELKNMACMWTYKSTVSLLLCNVDMCWILWIQWSTLSLLWQHDKFAVDPRFTWFWHTITNSYIVWLTHAMELEGMAISVLQNLGLRGKTVICHQFLDLESENLNVLDHFSSIYSKPRKCHSTLSSPLSVAGGKTRFH